MKLTFKMALTKCAWAASIFLLLTAFSEPTGQDIIKASQKVYDALTSYSDVSKAEEDAEMPWLKTKEHEEASYTTRLLRPNLYKIELTGSSPSGPYKGIIRSDGAASLMTLTFGSAAGDTHSMMAPDLQSNIGAYILGSGIPIAIDVPEIFLPHKNANTMLTELLSIKPGAVTTITRQADQKIGQTDCFVTSVVTDQKVPRPGKPDLHLHSRLSIAIGKQDFLIRRWQFGDGNINMTITHWDVVANPHLSPEDFAH
jgi:outer membrane lipoprotein-sorting protein